MDIKITVKMGKLQEDWEVKGNKRTDFNEMCNGFDKYFKNFQMLIDLRKDK